jgi:hypothetical protein
MVASGVHARPQRLGRLRRKSVGLLAAVALLSSALIGVGGQAANAAPLAKAHLALSCVPSDAGPAVDTCTVKVSASGRVPTGVVRLVSGLGTFTPPECTLDGAGSCAVNLLVTAAAAVLDKLTILVSYLGDALTAAVATSFGSVLHRYPTVIYPACGPDTGESGFICSAQVDHVGLTGAPLPANLTGTVSWSNPNAVIRIVVGSGHGTFDPAISDVGACFILPGSCGITLYTPVRTGQAHHDSLDMYYSGDAHNLPSYTTLYQPVAVGITPGG